MMLSRMLDGHDPDNPFERTEFPPDRDRDNHQAEDGDATEAAEPAEDAATADEDARQ